MAAERPDDRPLERLQDTASGEAATRQLRRRYDLLRADYEQLLDRLGELEHHFADSAEQANRGYPRPPSNEPAPIGGMSADLSRALFEPLLRLRAEYEAAAGAIERIISGLGSLAGGTLKGQRNAIPREATDRRGDQGPVTPFDPPARHTVTVRAEGGGAPAMLSFRERLAGMPDVERVSVAAIDEEQATLVVELSNDAN